MHKNDRSFIYQGKDGLDRKLHARVHVSPLGKPRSGRCPATPMAPGVPRPPFADVGESITPRRDCRQQAACGVVRSGSRRPPRRASHHAGARCGPLPERAPIASLDACLFECRQGVEVPRVMRRPGPSWTRPPDGRRRSRAPARESQSGRPFGRRPAIVRCRGRLDRAVERGRREALLYPHMDRRAKFSGNCKPETCACHARTHRLI